MFAGPALALLTYIFSGIAGMASDVEVRILYKANSSQGRFNFPIPNQNKETNKIQSTFTQNY